MQSPVWYFPKSTVPVDLGKYQTSIADIPIFMYPWNVVADNIQGEKEYACNGQDPFYYEQGKTIPEIITETDHDRKTITKYLDMTDFNAPEPVTPDPGKRYITFFLKIFKKA